MRACSRAPTAVRPGTPSTLASRTSTSWRSQSTPAARRRCMPGATTAATSRPTRRSSTRRRRAVRPGRATASSVIGNLAELVVDPETSATLYAGVGPVGRGLQEHNQRRELDRGQQRHGQSGYRHAGHRPDRTPQAVHVRRLGFFRTTDGATGWTQIAGDAGQASGVLDGLPPDQVGTCMRAPAACGAAPTGASTWQPVANGPAATIRRSPSTRSTPPTSWRGRRRGFTRSRSSTARTRCRRRVSRSPTRAARARWP